MTNREKFQEYFDLFVSNGSIPQITLPTRFSKNKATLIDQIFCRFTKHSSHKVSGIIVTKLSDHLPCFSVINYCTKNNTKPKYIRIQKNGPEAIESFKNEIKTGIECHNFNNRPLADPNTNYNKLETIITRAKDKCFPFKEVRFNKYRHKLSPWITFGIIESIKHETNCTLNGKN